RCVPRFPFLSAARPGGQLCRDDREDGPSVANEHSRARGAARAGANVCAAALLCISDEFTRGRVALYRNGRLAWPRPRRGTVRRRLDGRRAVALASAILTISREWIHSSVSGSVLFGLPFGSPWRAGQRSVLAPSPPAGASTSTACGW